MTSQGKKKKQVCRCYTVPLNYDLQKLAKLAKPDYAFHDPSITRDHLKCCISLMKKVGLKGSISRYSAKKATKQAIKHALAVLVEGNSESSLWFQLSVAKNFGEPSANFVLMSARKRDTLMRRKHSTQQIEGLSHRNFDIPFLNFGIHSFCN